MKRKIAVIGAGPAALSAVFHLTNFPGWQELYDITVYQPGHRVGGKATTARGPHCRIEELGIHILQGWYENTFRILRAVYKERRERGLSPGSDRSWHDAIEKDTSTFLTTKNRDEARWSSWTLVFPQDDLLPGTDQAVPATYHVKRVVALLSHFALGSPFAQRQGRFGRMASRYLRALFPDEPVRSEGPPAFTPPNVAATPLEALADYVQDASFRLDDNRELALEPWQHAACLRLLRTLWQPWCRTRRLLATRARRGTNAETTWQALDWLLTSVKGALTDVWDPDARKLIFARINHVDYRAWLATHGAHPETLESGLVRFMYYGSFANKTQGDRPGLLAADIALRMVINTLFYKGSLVWKTKKGSGTSMMVPLFEVLRARGVRFKFFHRLVDAVPNQNGEITELLVAEDARLATGKSEYDPIIYVGNDPDFAPTPDQAQLAPKAAEEPPFVHTLELGRDFDDVILALPVSALHSACASLVAANARIRRMVQTVASVGTFGAQTWLRPSQRDLGYLHEEWHLRAEDEPNSVNYEDPVYSWTDMTRILPAEQWPETRQPQTLAYFCGTLPDEPTLDARTDAAGRAAQHARVFGMVSDFLRNKMSYFWPAAVHPQSAHLDWDLLAIPEEDGSIGEERLRRQHLSVNTDPSNLYVLALPGTDAARLRTDDSGYSNLFLAGDWTDFGLNVGHLEGACVSGIRAALALLQATARRARAA